MARQSTIQQSDINRIHELSANAHSVADICGLTGFGKTMVYECLKRAASDDDLDPVQSAVYMDQIKSLRGQMRKIIAEQVKFRRFEQFIAWATEKPITIPTWQRKLPTERHEVIPCFHFTDPHYDEVVKPEEINWRNGYDRPTALLRTEKFFQSAIKVSKDYMSGFRYPGVQLLYGGDNFSGNIHSELRETNMAAIMESILYWQGPHVAGIQMLADQFGRVTVSGTGGNHSRNSEKSRYKGRMTDNFDWLWLNMIKQRLQDDPRISWNLPVSPDTRVPVYDTNFLLNHGDGFSGSAKSDVQLLSCISRGDENKRKNAERAGQPYHVLVIGHYHTCVFSDSIIIGGTLKGEDEYASCNNFRTKKPAQAYWMVDPKHGMTFRSPLFVECDNEPWKALKPAGLV